MRIRLNQVARAQALVGKGTVLLACRGKKPLLKDWPNLTAAAMTSDYLRSLCGGNIGVLLGTPSNGLCTIDIDGDEAVEPFLKRNPFLRQTLQTRGCRGINTWIYCKGQFPGTVRLTAPDGTKWGEFRSDGAQTIISGVHPDTGKLYKIQNAAHPSLINFEDIDWSYSISNPSQSKLLQSLSSRSTHTVTQKKNVTQKKGCLSNINKKPLSNRNKTFACLSNRKRKGTELSVLPWDKRLQGMYETKLAPFHTPAPHQRNDFLCKAVPALYSITRPDIALTLVMHFYDKHSHLFSDSAAQHQREAEALIYGMETTYLSKLTPREVEIYRGLDVQGKTTFRVCRYLALTSNYRFPAGKFFLSCGDLAKRLGGNKMLAHRILKEFCNNGILFREVVGTLPQDGKPGKASEFKWLLAQRQVSTVAKAPLY